MAFSKQFIPASFFRIEFVIACLAIPLIGWGIYQKGIEYQRRQLLAPPVTVDGIFIGGKKKSDVLTLLQAQSTAHIPENISLSFQKTVISSSSAQLGIHHSYGQVIDEVFSHTESIPPHMESTLTLNDQAFADLITEMNKKAGFAAQQPKMFLKKSGDVQSLTFIQGKNGQTVDIEKTKTALLQSIQLNPVKQASISAVIATVSAQLSQDDVHSFLNEAKKFVGKKLILTENDVKKELNDQAITSFLQFPDRFSDELITKQISSWKKEIDQPVQEPQFTYDANSMKVKTFLPPEDGVVVNQGELKKSILAQLPVLADSQESSLSLALPLQRTHPKKSLASTNTLGINERIGFGDSQYFHSIPGRVHNVSLTASRINNTLVKPGEEFSFVKTLGEVSAATGFKQAYVIKDGRTELGDGGGVCQVSSTLFRALLNGGLPITRRIAHSYRVSYYELNSKPGVDATVYAGNIDLRFINDTGHYLLIRTEADSKNLYMKAELYGTSDGRTAQIVDHKVWDITPAPPPLYQDDPSLPYGQIKQIDFAAAGAKASFRNIVKDKNGNVIREEEYVSDYKPWRAVFLRGI